MRLVERTIAAAVVTMLGFGGAAVAQQARDVNPSPMPPGSRAGDAPGMNPGTQAQQGGPADRGQPGGTGALAPSGQPDVGRGTAPGVAQGTTSTPGTPMPGTATPGTARPGTTAQGTTQGGAATGATTRGTAAEGAGAPVPGANSFTEGQARSRISDAGFSDVQELRLDDQGIWRGRAMRAGQQTGVALDYQGNVVATPR
jgi:hypothetical protein